MTGSDHEEPVEMTAAPQPWTGAQDAPAHISTRLLRRGIDYGLSISEQSLGLRPWALVRSSSSVLRPSFVPSPQSGPRRWFVPDERTMDPGRTTDQEGTKARGPGLRD